MSKNTGSEKLAEELAAMPQALDGLDLSSTGSAVILARVVKGLSREKWEAACGNSSLKNWHALPLPEDMENEEENLQAESCSLLQVTPFRDVDGALTRYTFLKLLQRELARLNRNGGTLSLISASLADRSGVVAALGEGTAKRLEATLGSLMLSKMDSCDALGLARRGVFICSLPGIGQLGARRFAESTQEAFAQATQPFYPAGGISAGKSRGCALGIVNILQGEACSPTELVRRARATLDVALRKASGYIHQESANTPLEGTTLVHSSEKRFLFFGGDPS